MAAEVEERVKAYAPARATGGVGDPQKHHFTEIMETASNTSLNARGKYRRIRRKHTRTRRRLKTVFSCILWGILERILN